MDGDRAPRALTRQRAPTDDTANLAMRATDGGAPHGSRGVRWNADVAFGLVPRLCTDGTGLGVIRLLLSLHYNLVSAPLFILLGCQNRVLAGRLTELENACHFQLLSWYYSNIPTFFFFQSLSTVCSICNQREEPRCMVCKRRRTGGTSLHLLRSTTNNDCMHD